MARAFLVVLDSLGCGGAPDASEFGDAGANTLGHIKREIWRRLWLPRPMGQVAPPARF